MKKIEEKIQQRRLQILVHSYLYYEKDQSIVSDDKWNQWAHELVELQEQYPEEADRVIYADMFKEFNGSTGMDFKYDLSIQSKAEQLLLMYNTLEPIKKVQAKKAKIRRLF